MKRNAQDVLAGFLLADIDLPNPKATKEELWAWIRGKVDEMNTIRRAFLHTSAEKLASPVDQLAEAYDDLKLAQVCNDDMAESAAMDRLNNIINSLLKWKTRS